ncbi:MAG: hypothetical protein F9K35_04585 [Burkholderiaceae bacterium]|nr:MAG: hypothetical protein F9K35_04585 [Burkholderiaceae bacterium]
MTKAIVLSAFVHGALKLQRGDEAEFSPSTFAALAANGLVREAGPSQEPASAAPTSAPAPSPAARAQRAARAPANKKAPDPDTKAPAPADPPADNTPPAESAPLEDGASSGSGEVLEPDSAAAPAVDPAPQAGAHDAPADA